MVAALDRVGIAAEQRKQARHHRAHAVAQRGGVGQKFRRRRRERAQHGERQAGLGARRIDVDVHRVTEARDAVRLLLPFGEALAPGVGGLGGEVLDAQALARGVGGVDPGLEVRRAQLREGEHQVAEVALGVDADRRHAVDRGFLEQREAETRLAAARHADADRVCRQVLGVIKDEVVLERVRARVEFLAQIEDAQFLVVDSHGTAPAG